MPAMFPQTFPLRISTEGWPEYPFTRYFIADVLNDGVVVAEAAKVIAVFTPPRPGIARTENPEAPGWGRMTEVVREPEQGEWQASVTLPSRIGVALCAKEVELRLGDSVAPFFVTEVRTFGQECVMRCEGMGTPPEPFWWK